VAAAWPALADVKLVLRISDTTDDAYITQCLAAAQTWVTGRVDPMYTTTPGPYFLPDPLFLATQAEAARLYRRRDSVDGTIGWGDMGVVRVGPKDPDIETLLAPYLSMVFG
jgi:hypothetical protein